MDMLEKRYPGKSRKMAVEYVTMKKIGMVLCA